MPSTTIRASAFVKSAGSCRASGLLSLLREWKRVYIWVGQKPLWPLPATGQRATRLAVSDTSEVNLQSHAGRLKLEELGVVGNDRDVAFLFTSTLALDAGTGFPLGLSALQLWTRDPNRPTSRQRGVSKSAQWGERILQMVSVCWAKSTLLADGRASLVTHIGDRESDLYERVGNGSDAFNHLLVRFVKTVVCWVNPSRSMGISKHSGG